MVLSWGFSEKEGEGGGGGTKKKLCKTDPRTSLNQILWIKLYILFKVILHEILHLVTLY